MPNPPKPGQKPDLNPQQVNEPVPMHDAAEAQVTARAGTQVPGKRPANGKMPTQQPGKPVFVQRVVSGETFTVLAASRLELEDEFAGLYYTGNAPERVILMPPFEPKVLASMIMQNNVLAQCIEAMEVNIDGTGFELVPAEEPDPEEKRRAAAEAAEQAAAASGQLPQPGAKPMVPEQPPQGGEKTLTEQDSQTQPASDNPDGNLPPWMAKKAPFDRNAKRPTDNDPLNPTAPPKPQPLHDLARESQNGMVPGQQPNNPESADGYNNGKLQPTGHGQPVDGKPVDGTPTNAGVTRPEEQAREAGTPHEEIADPMKSMGGTGMAEDGEMDPEERKRIKAFFDQPYPNLSFVGIRRKLRRQMESIGYAFLEVLRNAKGDLVGLRNVETYNTRMVKLDEPVLVKKTVVRDGEEHELQMWDRERRFMQSVPGHPNQWTYFREYGSTRQVDRKTGYWESETNPVAADRRGGELMVFGVIPDSTSPYFLPRWINQMPSVVGSRKAEENNLDLLDAGGLPPAMIFVQGGTLGKQTADELRAYVSGKSKNRNRAVVCEVMSNSGSFDGAQTPPQVKVERFGSEKVNDSMFREYDKNTLEHVRTGFRLPPLFLGLAQDYNFATAYTAYMVAEAQVFQPERQKFDEYINATLMRELGAKTCKFRSLPMTLKNVEVQLQAMQLVAQTVDQAGMVDEVNKIAGTSLEFTQPPAPPAPMVPVDEHGAPMELPSDHPAINGDKNPFESKDKGKRPTIDRTPAPPVMPGTQMGQGPLPGERGAKVPKPNGASGPPSPGVATMPTPGNRIFPNNMQGFNRKSARELLTLVQKYLKAEGLTTKKFDFTEAEKARVYAEVDALSEADSQAFFELVSMTVYKTPKHADLCQH